MFSEGQWNLHVITERVNPKFVFAVGDEHGDARESRAGSSSNRSSVRPPLAGAANTCSICSSHGAGDQPMDCPARHGFSDQKQDLEFMPTGPLAYRPTDAVPGRRGLHRDRCQS